MHGQSKIWHEVHVLNLSTVRPADVMGRPKLKVSRNFAKRRYCTLLIVYCSNSALVHFEKIFQK